MRSLHIDEWPSPENLDLRDWRTQAGPVATAYEHSKAPCAMIVGPTGGGKSTVSARRTLRVATWQHPSPRDGVRKARICVVCPTYRRAWDQVMPSYFKVFPQSLGTFRGSRGDPADHMYDLDISIGGVLSRIHVEVLFRAVHDMDIEEFVRGFEVTAWWLPECDTNDSENLISKCANRVGRYPEPDDRPDEAPYLAYKGVFGDANAPVIGRWFHHRFYMQRREGDVLFRQPSGTSVNAENMAQLRKIDPDYYGAQRRALDSHDFRRLIECRPGYGLDGQPVHPDFDEEVHVAKQTLEVDRQQQVIIGVDAGSNALIPGVAFLQRGYSGQWRALDEIHLGEEGEQLGTDGLAKAIRQKMDTRFQHAKGAMIAIDPAAMSGNAMSEFTTAQALQHLTQIEVQPAPTNDPKHRRGALTRLLQQTVPGAPREPRFVSDPANLGLNQALAGGFHYARRSTGVSPTPNKTNRFSHVAEACEYAVLTGEGIGGEVGARFIRPGGEEGYNAPKPIYDD